MPSRVLAVLLLTAVLLSLIPSALAYSWGLTGPLYAAGGSLAPDILRLHADGTCESGAYRYDSDGSLLGSRPAASGTWYITACSPTENKYTSPAEYEIIFITESGAANVKALVLHENGFSLQSAEGSGGYVPLSDISLPDAAD